MKNKFLYSLFALFLINTVFIGCKRDLTVVPNSVISEESVYTDKALITSTLARFYQQVGGNGGPGAAGWGATNATDDSYQQDPDDAQNNRGGASAQQIYFTKNRYRAFDYGLIRRINIFLQGIRSAKSKASMSPFENSAFEGQALFLRAWTFFHMVKTLGGLTIVGDEVFEFAGGEDATPLQLPRNSEADCYDYIIAQCELAATKLTNGNGTATIPANDNTNQALANRWAAKMLKARAALTAASIAKWNTPGDPLLEKTDKFGTQTHGIPANKADAYYKTAFDAAKEVIDGGAYQLMTGSTVETAQKAFENAINKKEGNTEVIWSTDRLSPNIDIEWTRRMAPVSLSDQAQGNQLGTPAEFVESFEYRATGTQGIKTRTAAVANLLNEGGVNNAPIMYDIDPSRPGYNVANNPFMQKDARLWGSAIWPQATWKGSQVDLRAGEWRGEYNSDGTLKVYTSAPPAKGTTNPENFLTAINGPAENTSQVINKTGFIPRKWLDEKPGAGLSPGYSDMWVIRFRLAEAYAICAEAALLSTPLGGAAVGVNYINVLRRRGLLPNLTAGQFDFAQLRRELRIEFYMEDHRLWDMNRWRLSHEYWDGPTNSKSVDYPNGTSYPMQLFPYVVNIAGNPGGNNGKYVFERKRAYRKRASPHFFEKASYYSNTQDSWRTWNPNWERNPGE